MVVQWREARKGEQQLQQRSQRGVVGSASLRTVILSTTGCAHAVRRLRYSQSVKVGTKSTSNPMPATFCASKLAHGLHAPPCRM